MAKRGTDYEGLSNNLAFPGDGRPMRRVKPWTLDKLSILAYYLPAFARATQSSGWYYFDGFAGNGANSMDGRTLKGSAIIGLTQSPAPTKALLIEKSRQDAEVLTARTDRFPGTQVMHGDVNDVLPDALRHFDNAYLPAFCVLDPEGLELSWSTVEALARYRRGKTPYELFIYFSTPGAARTGAVRAAGYAEQVHRRMTSLFGDDSWSEVANLYAKGSLPPGAAGDRYRSLYKSRLESLGYEVFDRPVKGIAGTRQQSLMYHLVFATAHPDGKRIMETAFARAYGHQLPLQF